MLGRLVGKNTPTRVTFVAEAKIKKMDYISLKDPEGRSMLGIIDVISRENDQILASVDVIGSRDGRGFLRAARVPFKEGTQVDQADEPFIRKTLGLPEEGIYMGTLDGYGIKVKLPPENLLQKHVAVLAKTGAGKSYATGVLLEELLENNVPAVVIDPHGEYHTLRIRNTTKEEVALAKQFDIVPKDYRDRIRILNISGKQSLKLSIPQTAQELWQMLPAKISAAHKGILYSAIKALNGHITMKGLIEEVSENASNAKWNLVSLLEHLDETGIFSETPTDKTELVKAGQVSIINLSSAAPDVQSLVVQRLAQDLFTARKKGAVPPFLFVVEEAHNFCPERGFGEVVSSRILRTIASEGRKFGMGLAIVSQRPARVDKSVLSQCNTQIILKVTNPNDLKAIVESVEGVTPGLKEEIKDLPVGVGIVVGVTEQPLVVDIRIRRTTHGGSSDQLVRELPEEGDEPVPEQGELFQFPATISEQDVASLYPGAQRFERLSYPFWRITDIAGKHTFIDGILGEVVFHQEGILSRSTGLQTLLELPEIARGIVLHLVTYTYATIERLADVLKVPVKQLRLQIRELINENILATDGFTVRNRVAYDIPKLPEVHLPEPVPGTPPRPARIHITEETAKALAKLTGTDAAVATVVYYPYWLVERDEKRFIVDARTREVDLRAAGALENI
ncbi:MAG: ATP-binding protein [Nanoarchaeota archaeon]|nr:ATP-binding protein [Nanoarchaeota archaeon]